MDTTPWINGEQNYHVRPNSQQPQQFWSQAGCSNTYPQYSEVNDPQSAQFNPGYGAYCSGQTSNHQTSTTFQQLPFNTGYSHLQNKFVHGNTNLHTSYNDAQTRNFPHQWQVSACQITTRQDPTTTENWSNQKPPNMTAQASCLSKCPRRRGASQSATHGKKMEATRKKSYKNTLPPPYTALTEMPPPPYTAYTAPSKHSRSKEHDATFDSSSGQLPGSQTHLQLQSGVRKAPAFSNSPVHLAPFTNNTQLSGENNGQLPQTAHLSVNPYNASSHPPPGYAYQRAVAVVQPLSKKGNQVTAKKSCPEMIGQHRYTSTDGCVKNITVFAKTSPALMKMLIECDDSEKNNGICSGIPSDLKDQLNNNVEPTDGGIVSTSHLTFKQCFSNDNIATLLSNGNGNQSEAPQLVTMEESQGREINRSDVQEMEMDNVGLLGLVPVITWTYEKLTSLIAISTKAQIQPTHSENVVRRLVKHLWDNDFKKLLSLVNTDYYNDLMADVIKFCNDTHNSPILSHVGSKSWHRLKEKFTVLDHNCVYFETPYVSPWLNVNERLDDIDKEFGFSSSLKHCESTCNTEMEPMETNCGIPVDIVKELAIEKVPQMAPALDVVEDIETFLPTKCSLSMVPDDALTADLKDPLDLLEIQILPPDEARLVFEQLKNESPMLEFISNEVIPTTEETTSMEEFCCINRWIEVISGTEGSLECSCKSRLESNKPCVISTDALLDPSEEENIIEVSSNPMQSNPSEISKIIDLAAEFEVPQKVYYNVPITHPSTTTDCTEEEEIVNDILSSINGESISTPALEEGCNKVELKPACPAVTLNIEPKRPQDHDDDDDHATSQVSTEPSEDHTSAPEAVLNIEEKQSNGDLHDFKSISSSLTTGPTRLSPSVEPKDDRSPSLKKRLRASGKRKTTKGKKMRKDKDSVTSVPQPALRDTSNNVIKEIVDADDSTTAAKNTVKLALFGSLPHRNGVSVPRGKSHSSCQYFSGRSHQPPSVITLTSSPVRNRLCEEWKKSYLPITRKSRKNKTIKDINLNSTSATVAPVEAKHVDMERLPISREQRYPIRSVKKRGRRKCTAKDLTLGTSKMSNKSVTKKLLVNMKSKSKSQKVPDMLLKENSELRFGVLCNTFDFKDGPKSHNDKRDSVLDTSDCAAKDDNGLKTAVKKSRAGWARIPDKKHSLLTSSNVSLQNKTTFQEFQKKHMKKRWLATGSCD